MVIEEFPDDQDDEDKEKTVYNENEGVIKRYYRNKRN